MSALKVTFITEVTILEGRLWPCAAAAMLAMVLRWFIWLIAMVTEAGGRLTGIRGCGIIMKGSSSPETHEEVVGYSMVRVMTDIFTGGKLANGPRLETLSRLIHCSFSQSAPAPAHPFAFVGALGSRYLTRRRRRAVPFIVGREKKKLGII